MWMSHGGKSEWTLEGKSFHLLHDVKPSGSIPPQNRKRRSLQHENPRTETRLSTKQFVASQAAAVWESGCK